MWRWGLLIWVLLIYRRHTDTHTGTKGVYRVLKSVFTVSRPFELHGE